MTAREPALRPSEPVAHPSLERDAGSRGRRTRHSLFPREHSLFPREHGASMELLFPLLTAVALGRPTLAGIAFAVATILVFVSHEAVLVLLGRRGQAFLAERGAEARRLLVGLLVPALGLGAFALVTLAEPARGAMLVPVVLAVPAWVVAMRRESQRTLPVELWVGAALASVALPVALDAGLSFVRAASLVAVWTLSHWLGTVAARAVLYRAKDGGRGLVLARALGAIVAVGCLGAWALGLSLGASLAWIALCPLPWALSSLYLASRPPPPTAMRKIGYGLVGASLLSSAFVLVLPW